MNYIEYMDQGGAISYPYYHKRVFQTPILNRLGIKLKYPPILYGINFGKMANDAVQAKNVDVKNSTVDTNGVKSNVQSDVSGTNTVSKSDYIHPIPKLFSTADGWMYNFMGNKPRP